MELDLEYYKSISKSYITRKESFDCYHLYNEEINKNLSENIATDENVLYLLYNDGYKLEVIKNLIFPNEVLEKLFIVEKDNDIKKEIAKELKRRKSNPIIKKQILIYKKLVKNNGI